MFEAVCQHLPHLSRWVEYTYDCESLLFVGGFHLLSSLGVQQGDPLGPLLFSITLQPLILALSEKFPDLLLNIWYLDDGTLVGPPHTVHAAFEFICEHGPHYGLHLNSNKCKLWWPLLSENDVSFFPAEVQRVFDNGIVLLGAPVGSPDFIFQYHQSVIGEINDLLSKAIELKDVQCQLLLLRSSLGMPRFAHLLRLCPPNLCGRGIASFDEAIHSFLEFVLNCSISQSTRLEMAAPVRQGGLGIPLASQVSICAHLGARVQFYKTNNLPITPDIEARLQAFNSSLVDISVSLDDLLASFKPQKFLSIAMHKSTVTQLQQQASGCHVQRLRHIFNKPALWLSALPGFDRLSANTMISAEFRLALHLWFGLKILPREMPCHRCYKQSSAKQICDPLGIHATRCAAVNNITHDGLRHLLFQMMDAAHFSVEEEQHSRYEHNPNSRPADILYHPGTGVPSICYDLTITSYHLPNGIAEAENFKRKKYADFIENNPNNFSFVPLALSSLGQFNAPLIQLLRKIARRQADLLGFDESKHIQFVLQKFQFKQMKLTARSLLDYLSSME